MPTTSLDHASTWNQPTYERKTARQHRVPRSLVESDVEWEFSDAMRSPRFGAGWFVLPSALVGLVLLLAILR
jgi:hypothetical protein